MRIKGVIWLNQFADKIESKHDVSRDEVEQLFLNKPVFRFVEFGHTRGEDLYRAIGQTDAGRYLIVFFIYKAGGAMPISARDATKRERKNYGY